MAIARKHKKNFSTSHNTVIITITRFFFLVVSLSISHTHDNSQMFYGYYFIFFIIAIRMETKPWNYSIKSSNSVNAPNTHMILLRVLKKVE